MGTAWILLGLSMVSVISGCDDLKILASRRVSVGDSVLLPCTCSQRDEDGEVKWQLENKWWIFIYKDNFPKLDDRYKDRVSMFLNEPDRNNCSIHLTNVTERDQGSYRCTFFSAGIYTPYCVNLTVVASDHTHQPRIQTNPPSSSMSTRCSKTMPLAIVFGFFLKSEILH